MNQARGDHRGTGVLVLGMHRSGTSALAGVLNLLGAVTPGDLMPATQDNERGYFEKWSVVRFNDAVLAELGSAWDDPLPIGAGWIDSPAARDSEGRLRALIEAEFADAAFFSLKDPRISRLLPLWLPALATSGWRVAAAIPLRHPLEVVGSVQRRDKLPRAQVLLSWLDHMLAAEAGSRGIARSFVLYADLLADWRGEIERMRRELDLAWSTDLFRVEGAIDAFLGSDLRHHRSEEADLRRDDPLEGVCADVWDALKGLRDDPRSEAAQDALDRARNRVAQSVAVLGPVVVGLRETGRLAALALDERRIAINDQAHEIRARDEMLALRASEIRTRDDHLEIAANEILTRDETLALREEAIRARDEGILARDETLARHEAMFLEQGEQARARDRQIGAALEQTAAVREAAGREREAGARERAEIVEAHRQERESLLEAQRREREAMVESARRHAEQQTLAYEDALHWARHETDRQRKRASGMQRSMSWQVTRPLRAIVRLSPRPLRGIGRRVLRGSWWAVTGQLARRLRERRKDTLAVQRTPVALETGPVQAVPPAPVPPAQVLPAPAPAERFEIMLAPEHDRALRVPFAFDVPPSTERVGVVCHIFHDELASEIKRYLRSIGDADVFISTDTEAKRQRIEVQFRDWAAGTVDVRVLPNRGRDIAPKLVGFAEIYERYEIVLHLHSKQSLHDPLLAVWRPYLMETLVGSPEIVRSILFAFRQRPDLGIVAAQHFEPVRHHIDWAGNLPVAQDMAARMGFALDPQAVLDFPSGSMFWARSAALRPLLKLAMTFDDFPSEAGQVDGTRAHAIERLYYLVCEAAGLGWAKVARDAFFTRGARTSVVTSGEDLDRFLDEHETKLLENNAEKRALARPQAVATVAKGLLEAAQRRHLGLGANVAGLTIHVGVVTYNNAEDEIGRILRSIRKGAGRMPASAAVHALVLDNGESTSDLTRDMPGVEAVEPIGNVGFGRAHNHLMRRAFEAGADLYIAANPDGAFHPDAIAHLASMSAGHDHRALIEAVQFPAEHPKLYDLATLATPWASGACLLIPRELYDATQGFDDTFFMYGEDVDLSWRSRAAGFEVKICPRALFLHAVTNRVMTPARLKMIYESGDRLAKRWGNAPFETWVAHETLEADMQLEEKSIEAVPQEWRRFSDFSHHFSFARTRW